jgi:ribose/xylose/arabinose/galactoside ABC-type transport system permease subunit
MSGNSEPDCNGVGVMKMAGPNEHQMIRRLSQNREFSIVVFIVFLLIVLATTMPAMLAPANMVDTLQNIVIIGLLTLGALVVIVARGIDLSIGANMGFVALLVGKLALDGWPLWLLILLAVLVGMIGGAINGLLVTLLKLPPIIVTLGTLSIYSGAMFRVTEGQWVMNLPESLTILGSFKVFGIPGRMVILAVVAVLMVLLMQYSIKGRHIYAVGNNPNAARLAGIQENRIIFLTYVIAGFMAGLAGVLYISYTGFATPTTGLDMQLVAIAAAVIGGASVFGGRGTPFGAMLGSFMLVIIATSLVFYHLPAVWNQAAQGLIILIAVTLDAMMIKRNGKKGAA